MIIAFCFMRRQFGKVMTPMSVHSARLPNAFGLFYTKVGRLDKKLILPEGTALLIREEVARMIGIRRAAAPSFVQDDGRGSMVASVIKASVTVSESDAKRFALDESNSDAAQLHSGQ